MDQLIDLITAKTGIPRETAKQAADIVIGFLKEKLPPPMAAQVDNVVGMHIPEETLNQVQDTAGGFFNHLFGHKKD